MAPLLPSTRLVACPSCREHIKSSDTACPHCGAEFRAADGRIVRAASAVLMGLALAGCPDKGGDSSGSTGNDTDMTSDATDEPMLTDVGEAEYGAPVTEGFETLGEPEYGVPQTTGTGTGTGTGGEPDYGVPATTGTGGETDATGSGTETVGEPEYGVPSTTSGPEPDYGVPSTTGD